MDLKHHQDVAVLSLPESIGGIQLDTSKAKKDLVEGLGKCPNLVGRKAFRIINAGWKFRTLRPDCLTEGVGERRKRLHLVSVGQADYTFGKFSDNRDLLRGQAPAKRT